MKNLKKTLSLVLCLMMALALLASCGGKEDEAETVSTAADATQATEAPAAAETTPPVVTELTPADLILGVWELSEIAGDDVAAAELAKIKERGASVTCTLTKTDMTWDSSYANEKYNGSVPYVVEDGKIVYGDTYVTYVLEDKKLTMIDPANEALTMVFTLKKSMVPATPTPVPAATEAPAN